MARLSSGQDAGLSRQNQEFDSPTSYQLRKEDFMKVWVFKKCDYEDSCILGVYTEEGKQRMLDFFYECAQKEDEKTLQKCDEKIRQLREERKIIHNNGEELLQEERLSKECGNRPEMLAIRKKRRAMIRDEQEYTHKIRIIEFEKNLILNGSKQSRLEHYLNTNNLYFYEYELDSNFNFSPEYLWLDD